MEHPCSFCPGNTATCHLTKVVNGKLLEIHVCEKCIPEVKDSNLADFDIWDAVSKLAAEKGMPDPSQGVEPPPVEEISAKSLLMESSSDTAACPACGFSNEDLRKIGRLGCPQCYDVFEDMLKGVIKDCQKGPRHTGKVPHGMMTLKLKRLEEQLDDAVREERFEEAAKLRDQIKSLS